MGSTETRFPGGTYRLDAAENERLCQALGAEPDPDGKAHPLFYYIATQVGMGLSVEDLLRLCDFDVRNGPMMTASETTISRDMWVDCSYRIEGEIESLVRRPSRTLGWVDSLRFRLRLLDEEGAIIVDCINSWILPRRGAKS